MKCFSFASKWKRIFPPMYFNTFWIIVHNGSASTWFNLDLIYILCHFSACKSRLPFRIWMQSISLLSISYQIVLFFFFHFLFSSFVSHIFFFLPIDSMKAFKCRSTSALNQYLCALECECVRIRWKWNKTAKGI